LLNGSVIPVNATNRAIAWTVEDAGGTGAAISGNMLSSTSEGVVRIRALITGGISAAEDFTKDFEITLSVPVYRVELSVNSQGWGSVTGGGNYSRGSVIEINAAAAAGYRFTEWRNADGSRYSLLATVEVAVYKNESLTAIFEPAASGGEYAAYWGKSANEALEDISVLVNSVLTDTRARQLPFAATADEQYYYYAYPSVWGEAVFTQGGGTIDSMILSTAEAGGTAYYVYRSLYPGTAATVFNAE
jgi:hypothetical protein